MFTIDYLPYAPKKRNRGNSRGLGACTHWAKSSRKPIETEDTTMKHTRTRDALKDTDIPLSRAGSMRISTTNRRKTLERYSVSMRIWAVPIAREDLLPKEGKELSQSKIRAILGKISDTRSSYDRHTSKKHRVSTTKRSLGRRYDHRKGWIVRHPDTRREDESILLRLQTAKQECWADLQHCTRLSSFSSETPSQDYHLRQREGVCWPSFHGIPNKHEDILRPSLPLMGEGNEREYKRSHTTVSPKRNGFLLHLRRNACKYRKTHKLTSKKAFELSLSWGSVGVLRFEIESVL